MDNKTKRKKVAYRKRRHRQKIFLTIFLLAAFMALAMAFFCNRGRALGFLEQGKFQKEEQVQDPAGLCVDLKGLYSSYGVLVETDSGTVIGENRSTERIYPASLTKIMTAIIAVEETADLDASVRISEEMFAALYAEEASMAGFLPGENASLRDLLYGILLPSGAECCIAFAEYIAGSESAFVELMNQKAEELGMKHTHFVNTTGLHDREHYSTVEDISVLLRYALKNQDFREAFTSDRHSVQASEQHPEGFTFYSTMFPYMDSFAVTGGEIIGGKTGYTKEAGLCLASLAQIYGKEYILVTAKANGSHETEPFHILDAVNVYEQLGEKAGAV